MEITVVVTPNARVPVIVKLGANSYKAKVNAPATEGRANARLVEMLAEHFHVPMSRVRILRGIAGRKKTIGIIQ